jgi:hypothetical protein
VLLPAMAQARKGTASAPATARHGIKRRHACLYSSQGRSLPQTRVRQFCGGGKDVRTTGREGRHGLSAGEFRRAAASVAIPGWSVFGIPTGWTYLKYRPPLGCLRPVRSASCGSDRVDPGRRAASPSSGLGHTNFLKKRG